MKKKISACENAIQAATLKKNSVDQAIVDNGTELGQNETFLDDKVTGCAAEEQAYKERDDKR